MLTATLINAKDLVIHEISNKCFSKIYGNKYSLQDHRKLSQYNKLWDKLLRLFTHHANMWVITPTDGSFNK